MVLLRLLLVEMCLSLVALPNILVASTTAPERSGAFVAASGDAGKSNGDVIVRSGTSVNGVSGMFSLSTGTLNVLEVYS